MKFAIGWLRYSFPLGIGASLAPVKVLYSFLPGFNVLDVLVFGGLSALLVRSTSGRWWLGPILLVAPSMFVVAWILRLLGIEDLRAGARVEICRLFWGPGSRQPGKLRAVGAQSKPR